jgi:4-hydroxy-tetrahydrodipicolinate reductase
MLKIALFGKGKLGKLILALAPNHKIEVTDTFAADILIDATGPEAVVKNILFALELQKPIVVATTGWYDQLEYVQQLVKDKDGFCLYSPNFSPLVQNLLLLLPKLQLNGYSIRVEETHHLEKKDAPSGTALALAHALGGVPISSHRIGDIVGNHRILIENSYERLTLEHEGFDRALFAEGLLSTLHKIGSRKGMFNLKEFLC